MLPDATIEQKIATGFHRNAMTNEEGGVDPEESRYEVLVDRANTTATVWLGSTLACAQCHNHKCDPFTQKDYFRVLSFIANNDYDGRAVRRHALLRADARTATRTGRAQELQANIERLDQRLKTPTPSGRRAEDLGRIAAHVVDRMDRDARSASATNGVTLRIQPMVPCSPRASTPRRRATPSPPAGLWRASPAFASRRCRMPRCRGGRDATDTTACVTGFPGVASAAGRPWRPSSSGP